jgi:hypothetical protein
MRVTRQRRRLECRSAGSRIRTWNVGNNGQGCRASKPRNCTWERGASTRRTRAPSARNRSG